MSVNGSEFRYTASAGFLETLYAAGVRYLFVNLGTDHPVRSYDLFVTFILMV